MAKPVHPVSSRNAPIKPTITANETRETMSPVVSMLGINAGERIERAKSVPKTESSGVNIATAYPRAATRARNNLLLGLGLNFRTEHKQLLP